MTGGKVLGVRQHDFDRVLVFEIGKADGKYELVVECFHNGNVVLVKDGEIIQPLIHTEWSSRVIRPGRDWHFPPMAFNPKTASDPKFIEQMRSSDTDLIRTLSSVCNMGPLYAEEVCLRAGVDKELAIEDATSEQLAKVARATKTLLEKIQEAPEPTAYFQLDEETGEEHMVDCAPVALKVREKEEDLRAEPIEHLWEALDEVFAPGAHEEGIQDQRLQQVEGLKGRYERQIEDIGERLSTFQDEEERERAAGDLLYAHFADVDQLLKQCQEMHREGGWGPLFQETPSQGQVRIERLIPEHGQLLLAMPDAKGEERQIKVDIKKSLGANAEAHYERSKEMREKQEGAKRALAEAKKKLSEVEERGEELIEELEREAAKPDPTHRFWFDKYRWFVSSDGLIVVGGRDARSNERVVKKYLEDNDRYVHANLQGAPSVVVKSREGEPVPERTLEEASAFAVSYSKAWRQAVGQGQAYWVTPPQVSKTPESGEYVPHGSFIIRGERNYVRAPVRCAVGEVHVEGHRKLMGGPVSAVENRSDKYLVLEPGKMDQGPMSNVLSEIFDIPQEEVLAVLPPGPMRVVESLGINEELLEGV
ncbi:MAG: ribosome rescue protein RqcH, partial [Candidatus Thermoplasmatota archaeon]|nr:ribosome rescue protein RqcH [Candidatus Thermoplasmatota archaeon]